MDKHLQEHIEMLLHLYDEARTTDEQEAELAEFFCQATDIPEAWQGYAALFSVFKTSDSLFSEDEMNSIVPVEHRSHSAWLKIAAMFIGVLLISGIALAAVHFIHNHSKQSTDSMVETDLHPSNYNLQPEEAFVRFSNTPLDSVLSVVGTHYGRAVCFRDKALRQLRFTISWDSIQPLCMFLNNVNEFEGLQLVDERDTIFVNTEKEVQP